MIFKGNNSSVKIYKGNTEIIKAYYGDKVVYENFNYLTYTELEAIINPQIKAINSNFYLYRGNIRPSPLFKNYVTYYDVTLIIVGSGTIAQTYDANNLLKNYMREKYNYVWLWVDGDCNGYREKYYWNGVRTGDLTEPSGTGTSTWFTGEISSNWNPTQSGREAIGRLTCETSNPDAGPPNLIHIDSFGRYPICFSKRPFPDGFRPTRS